jgi:PKHD-type hydroxylase
MLLPIANVLSTAEVAYCRSRLVQGCWQDGRHTAGGQAALVKANLQLDANSPLAAELGELILRALAANPAFLSAALPKKIFPPKFNCYRDGGHYGLHVDNAILYPPDGHPLRSDVSATLFLSAPEEYQGGELCIETQYGAQQVKLNAGDMILYPATSLHEVKPVTSGARLCSFFWLESLVANSHHRELLFDLDQSIQVLTSERGGQDDEVRRLTGIYHNLVRTWGQS